MPDRAVMTWEDKARVSDIHIIEWTATVGGHLCIRLELAT